MAVAMFAIAFSAGAQGVDTDKLLANIKKAEEATQNEKKAVKPATWIKLGDVYYSAYQSLKGNGWIGMTNNDIALVASEAPSSQEEVRINGVPYIVLHFTTKDYYFNQQGIVDAIIITKQITDENLLISARDAYLKAIEVDTKGSKKSAIAEKLIIVRDAIIAEAMSYNSINRPLDAAKNFEASLPCNENAAVNAIDTLMVYYSGVSYNIAGDIAKAKPFYERCFDLGYFQDGDVPAALAGFAKQEGDISRAKEILHAAFEKYPSSQAVLIELINLYLESNDDPEKILDLIRKAQSNEPDNASLVYAEGNVYKNLGNVGKAIECYRKSYEMDPTYVYGIYAVGNAYFDLAIETQTAMDTISISDTKGYQAALVKFEGYLMSSVEPFETAFNDPNATEDIKIAAASALKQVYFRFRDREPKFMELAKKYEDYLNSKDAAQAE